MSNSSMNSSKFILRSLSGAFLTAAALGSAGNAFAEQPTVSVTRAQVLAEYIEAKRTGELVWTFGSNTQKLNEFFPQNYPAKVKAPGPTREQVLAEFIEAKRTGELVWTLGSNTQKLNEFFPQNYPAKVKAPGPTREQVLAEFIEAKRTGELVWTFGSDTRKLNEFFPQNYPKMQ